MLTQPLLMSDDNGNIFRDAKKDNSILKSYIDSGDKDSMTTAETNLQQNISSLQGKGYNSATTLASLQQQIDDLTKNAVMKYSQISLVLDGDAKSGFGTPWTESAGALWKAWESGWGTTTGPPSGFSQADMNKGGALHTPRWTNPEGGFNGTQTNGDWNAGFYTWRIAPPSNGGITCGTAGNCFGGTK